MAKKKSKFRHIQIGSKKYYFYKITWLDITGDSGHATSQEFNKFLPSKMIKQKRVLVIVMYFLLDVC